MYAEGSGGLTPLGEKLSQESKERENRLRERTLAERYWTHQHQHNKDLLRLCERIEDLEYALARGKFCANFAMLAFLCLLVGLVWWGAT